MSGECLIERFTDRQHLIKTRDREYLAYLRGGSGDTHSTMRSALTTTGSSKHAKHAGVEERDPTYVKDDMRGITSYEAAQTRDRLDIQLSGRLDHPPATGLIPVRKHCWDGTTLTAHLSRRPGRHNSYLGQLGVQRGTRSLQLL